MLLVLAALPSYGVLVLLALSTGICILAFFLLHAQQKRIPPLSVQPSKTTVDTLLRLMPEGYVGIDAQANIVEVNDSYLQMTGYTRQQLTGRSIKEIVVTGEGEDFDQHLKQISQEHAELFDTTHRMYSVPYKLVGKKLLVRATPTTVRIFFNEELVATHERATHKGQKITNPEHLPESYRAYASWSGASFRYRAKSMGENTYHVIDGILKSYEFEVQAFRRCVGILNLARKHSPEMLERACSLAAEDGRSSYKYIKNLLDSMVLEPNETMQPAGKEKKPSPFARPKGFYSVLPSKMEDRP